MCVYVHVSVFLCVYVCLCVRISVCVRDVVHISIPMCACVCIYVYVPIGCISLFLRPRLKNFVKQSRCQIIRVSKTSFNYAYY